MRFFLLVTVLCVTIATCMSFRLNSHRVKSSFLTMGRIPIIAGNWKLNTDLKTSVALASEVASLTKAVDPSNVEIVVVPPYPFITSVKSALENTNVKVGAQNAYSVEKGAFTGAVSSTQLASCGCHYCIVGHSERRTIFGETDSQINLIVHKIHESGMLPILCIGETKEEYELGISGEICTIELARNLKGLTPEQVSKTVIAYEPIWAIGTGLTASPEIAQGVHYNIRQWLRKAYGNDVAESIRIQYGGSVTADNVDALLQQPDIDGALVGGASLIAASFARIVNFQS